MKIYTPTNKITKALNDKVNSILEFEAQIKELKAKSDALKDEIKTAMENENCGSIKTDTFSITYKGATTRVSIDTKKLKDENLELFQKYSKTSNVKSSISIKAL